MNTYEEKDFGNKSILRFTGGKQKVVKYLSDAMPNNWNNYYELFLGGLTNYKQLEIP